MSLFDVLVMDPMGTQFGLQSVGRRSRYSRLSGPGVGGRGPALKGYIITMCRAEFPYFYRRRQRGSEVTTKVSGSLVSQVGCA